MNANDISVHCGIASSPDGRYIVSGIGYTVKIWDAEAKQLLWEFIEQDNRCTIFSAAVSPDGKYAVIGKDLAKVTCWDIQSGQMVFEKELIGGFDQNLCSVDYSPDGDRIITGFGDGSIIILDAKNGEEIRRLVGYQDFFKRDYATVNVKYSPNGRHIVSGSIIPSDTYLDQTGIIKIWDASTGEKLKVISPPFEQREEKQDGRKPLRPIIKMETLSPVSIQSIAYGLDGKDVVTSDQKGMIKIWNLEKGKEIIRFLPKEQFLVYIWEKPVEPPVEEDGKKTILGFEVEKKGDIYKVKMDNAPPDICIKIRDYYRAYCNYYFWEKGHERPYYPTDYYASTERGAVEVTLQILKGLMDEHDNNPKEFCWVPVSQRSRIEDLLYRNRSFCQSYEKPQEWGWAWAYTSYSHIIMGTGEIITEEQFRKGYE